MEFGTKDIEMMKDYFLQMYNELADYKDEQVVTGNRTAGELRAVTETWINGLSDWGAYFDFIGKEGEQRFELKDYVAELTREMALRRKVYKGVKGEFEKFIDRTHQKQYDVLKELREILGTVSLVTWRKVFMEYNSVKGIVQASLFE